jgi:hypothetical protein
MPAVRRSRSAFRRVAGKGTNGPAQTQNVSSPKEPLARPARAALFSAEKKEPRRGGVWGSAWARAHAGRNPRHRRGRTDSGTGVLQLLWPASQSATLSGFAYEATGTWLAEPGNPENPRPAWLLCRQKRGRVRCAAGRGRPEACPLQWRGAKLFAPRHWSPLSRGFDSRSRSANGKGRFRGLFSGDGGGGGNRTRVRQLSALGSTCVAFSLILVFGCRRGTERRRLSP